MAALKQHATDKIKRLLGAVHDHDSPGASVNPAMAQEAICYSGAQLFSALPWSIVQISHACSPRAAPKQSAPHRLRKIRERGPDSKVVWQPPRLQVPSEQSLARKRDHPFTRRC